MRKFVSGVRRHREVLESIMEHSAVDMAIIDIVTHIDADNLTNVENFELAKPKNYSVLKF